MSIELRIDDLSTPEVQGLVAEHMSGMHRNSPPDHVYALSADGLKHPSMTFWSAWIRGRLCGCGALKELDTRTGEIKSMRTRDAFLRQGVGQAVLDEIVRAGRKRGYTRLYLETGYRPGIRRRPCFLPSKRIRLVRSLRRLHQYRIQCIHGPLIAYPAGGILTAMRTQAAAGCGLPSNIATLPRAVREGNRSVRDRGMRDALSSQ